MDVISSQGWLAAATGAMDLSQMLVQGQWESDSPLVQLPHVTKDLAAKCDAAGCPDIIALQDLQVRMLCRLCVCWQPALLQACVCLRLHVRLASAEGDVIGRASL